jgi:type II secretory ATPase GspE/PulE/Tfp pilus assembly ATPase PilB-like protein
MHGENLVAPWKAPDPRGTAAIGKGCLECRLTGHMGRIGIYVTQVLNPALKRHITDTTDLETFHDAACKDG